MVQRGEKYTNNLLINLLNSWTQKINKEILTANLPWQENIQGDIQLFLIECEDCFSKSESITKTNEEIINTVIQALMKQHGVDKLPEAVELSKIETWKSCRKYFNNVAHHKTTDIEHFEVWLSSLEALLHGLLIPPRTFDNMQALLKIIEQGERYDN